MKYDEQIQSLLSKHGAVLQRDKRHLVYRLPSGQVFTMAKTPSDERAAANALSDLRNLLGITDPERGKPGERRPRKAAGPERKPRIHAAPQNTALADQLRTHGVEADALHEKIADLEKRLHTAHSECDEACAERDYWIERARQESDNRQSSRHCAPRLLDVPSARLVEEPMSRKPRIWYDRGIRLWCYQFPGEADCGFARRWEDALSIVRLWYLPFFQRWRAMHFHRGRR